jgi:hypothetical protein
MISPQPRSRAQAVKRRKDPAAQKLAWPTYLGITALLLLFVVALAGGIIWYNSLKTTELMVAEAERQMIETGEKISERIGLLYDPLYAIVAIASQMPELKAPLHDDGHTSMSMLLQALRFYPQILSLYVGFDNGDFFMVSHISGEGRAPMRIVLDAPEKAAFANESITTGSDGVRTVRWMMTVSRSDAVTSPRRVSILGSAPGMDRRATVISCSGVICTSLPRARSPASPCGTAGGTRHAINQTIEGCAPTDQPDPQGDCAGPSEGEGSRNPRPSPAGEPARARREGRASGRGARSGEGEGCWRL